MQKYNNDTLIQNILALMKNNGLTQESLAGNIGMSQPNFNRAIHNADGKRFTVEQIFDIAQYFGVSIDWLMGNQDISSITPKFAAEFITKAVSSSAAKLFPISVKEESYISEGYHEMRKPKKVTSNYLALYFPNYEDPCVGVLDEEEIINRIQIAEYAGNQTMYWSLNSYLEKFEGFYKLLTSRSMDKEDFQTLVAKHLKKIDEE